MNKIDGTKLDFVHWLENAIAGEANARIDYYDLLRLFPENFSKEELSQIEEIIAEELKHTEILSQIVKRVTGIVPEK